MTPVRLLASFVCAVFSVALGACVPAATTPGVPCNDDSSCRRGEACVEGACAPASDTSAPPPSCQNPGRTDAGEIDATAASCSRDDSGVLDAGPVDAAMPLDAAVLFDAAVPPDVDVLSDAGGEAGPGDAGNALLPLSIEVTAQTAVESGYAVALSFDHAALVAAGARADGRDLVLRPLVGDSEVPFVLDGDSAWNRADTKIWFRLAAGIDANGVAGYQMSLAAPSILSSWQYDDVFLAGDNFDDGALSETLTAFTHLLASIEEVDGRLVIDMSDDQAEAAVVSATTPLPEDRRFTIRHRMRLDHVDGDDEYYNVKSIGIVQWPSQPSYAPSNRTGENLRQRIIVNQGIEGRSYIYFQDADNRRYSWTSDGWVLGDTWWGTLPFGVDHVHKIESDGDSFVVVIQSTEGVELVRTTPVSWTNVFVRQEPEGGNLSTGPFWFYWGEVYVTGEPLPDGGVTGGPYYTADLSSDWLVYRPFVSPEPVAVVVP